MLSSRVSVPLQMHNNSSSMAPLKLTECQLLVRKQEPCCISP